ncbi:L-ascorbate oxidase -like protein [Capsicum chinense]|nr:L-ascorbate oxidase -like protein [Capsicum chinense]
MREKNNVHYSLMLTVILVCVSTLPSVYGDNPYRYYTWKITYGDIYPLGVKQQGILINGQFPGPQIDCVTNDNLIISVYNYLNEPFLISWNGIQQRRNSWQDGVYGTTCPILPGKNFTYTLQAKDQIGSYFYFPSLGMHKAAGGYGAIRVYSRPRIPVPFAQPAQDFTVLAGDLYKRSHRQLKYILDSGHDLPLPDGLIINGRGWNGYTFTVNQGNLLTCLVTKIFLLLCFIFVTFSTQCAGKTYRFRISNVGIATSINFRIQGHTMKLVEVEGSHTLQTTYTSLDIHLGQSYSVLVTANQPPKDYYVVVSSRFTRRVLTTTAVLHYSNSWTKVSGPLPGGPTTQINWSIYQARSIRWNLTASGPRPNPQGSYHYGLIKPSRTIMLANSAPYINGKQRYAVNSVSYTDPDTPLKLADYFNIGGVYNLGSISDQPYNGNAYIGTPVMAANFRSYIEIIFQNWENTVQSWHIDGYSFFVVGMDGGQWTPASRSRYNLRDTVARCTTQVCPNT